MIVKISSDNPQFSWILCKNPVSPPVKKDIRQGKGLGFFEVNNPQSYYLHFIEGNSRSSFTPAEVTRSEPLDSSEYLHPFAACQLITSLLSTAVTDPNETDIYPCTVTTMVRIAGGRRVRSVAERLGVEITPVEGDTVSLTIVNPSIKGALQTTALFCFLLSCLHYKASQAVFVSEDLLKKYARFAKDLKAPYYAKYILLLQTTSQQFDAIASTLSDEGEKFARGDSRAQRFNEVKKYLSMSGTLYDIGCGELYQSSRLIKDYDTLFAIDTDEEIQAANRVYVDRKEIPLTLLAELPTELEAGADFLLTEVLEHMSPREAKELLTRVVASSPKNVVVTVPNRSFNHHFGLGSREFRHDDHKWEPTIDQFQTFIDSIPGVRVSLITPIGDTINNTSISLLAHLTC
jgi:hypothetical protein